MAFSFKYTVLKTDYNSDNGTLVLHIVSECWYVAKWGGVDQEKRKYIIVGKHCEYYCPFNVIIPLFFLFFGSHGAKV